MTRKDYIAIAKALRDDAAHIGAQRPAFDYTSAPAWNRGAYDQWNTTVLALANVLAADNSSFDRAKFLAACGIQS